MTVQDLSAAPNFTKETLIPYVIVYLLENQNLNLFLVK